MKKNALFTLTITFCFLSAVLSGCATVKEMGKGFMGISTQVLKDQRKDALKKSFALDYNSCYLKVKEILKQKDKESYIYAEEPKEKLIAIYLKSWETSDTTSSKSIPSDTTPVGIFFTEEASGGTLIEISSPSIYAKEEIAARIFTGIDELIKPKIKESKPNVEEKTGN
jgi:hypothetical protein